MASNDKQPPTEGGVAASSSYESEVSLRTSAEFRKNVGELSREFPLIPCKYSFFDVLLLLSAVYRIIGYMEVPSSFLKVNSNDE